MNKQDQYISEQRQDLKSYLDEHSGDDGNISANAVSRNIGVSSTVISQFINDKYPGDNYSIAKKIESFLIRESDRLNHKEIFPDILLTKNVRRYQTVAKICHAEGEIGVVTGEAGVSKTCGAKYYEERNPGSVILIEVAVGMTSKVLAQEIHKAIGLDGSGTLYSMFLNIVEKLKGTNRLIAIDEAENLPTSGLELARRIHDMAGIGVVLSGLPRLLTNLRGLKGEFKQLSSRVAIKAELGEPDEDDFKILVHSAIPGSNGLYKKFYKRTNNARELSKILKRYKQLKNLNPEGSDEGLIDEAVNIVII